MCQLVPSEMTVLQEYWDASDTVADPSMVPDVEPMVTAFAPLFTRLMVMGCWPLRSTAVGSVTVNAPAAALARITRSSDSTVYAEVIGIANQEATPASCQRAQARISPDTDVFGHVSGNGRIGHGVIPVPVVIHFTIVSGTT